MAKGFINWSNYELFDDIRDLDWVEEYSGPQADTNVTIREETGSPTGSDKVLRIWREPDTTSNRFYYQPSVSESEDWEVTILGRVENGGEGSHNWGGTVRFQEGSNYSGYTGATRNNETEIRLIRHIDGNTSFPDITDLHGIDKTIWYWIRVRIQGSDFKFKIW